MSAVEVRALARAVIEAGGNYDDLCKLVRLWKRSREGGASGTPVDRLVAEIIDTFDAVEIDEYGAPVGVDTSAGNKAVRHIEELARQMFSPAMRALLVAKPIDCSYPDQHSTRHRPHPVTGRTVCHTCHPPVATNHKTRENRDAASR